MPITNILNKFFSSTCLIERRSTSTTSTGDLSETWATLGTNIAVEIQPLSISEQTALSQGSEYIATHKAYIPDDIITPKNGDRLTDLETNKVHDIVSVQHFKASRNDITTGHHYKLLLNISRDTKA